MASWIVRAIVTLFALACQWALWYHPGAESPGSQNRIQVEPTGIYEPEGPAGVLLTIAHTEVGELSSEPAHIKVTTCSQTEELRASVCGRCCGCACPAPEMDASLTAPVLEINSKDYTALCEKDETYTNTFCTDGADKCKASNEHDVSWHVHWHELGSGRSAANGG